MLSPNRSICCHHGAAGAPIMAGLHARRLKLTPCAALHRDVSAQVSTAVSVETSSSTTTSIPTTTTSQPKVVQSKPYRVTDATIKDIKDFHKSQLCEYDYIVDDSMIEGTIPKELVGTYLRNGPGMQTAGRHTFDGDGQVVAFSFDGSGRVRFTNKFVRTRGFLDEQAAGRPVHRTAFTRGAADGSLFFNPFDMKLKNVANTGVLHWANKLLALYESNLPYELDPASLNTFGACDMHGQLQTPVLAAHYRVMPGQQQLEQQQRRQHMHSSSNDNGKSSNGSSNSSNSDGNGHASTASQMPAAAGADGRRFVGFSFNSGLGSGAEMIFYEFGEDGRLAVAPQHYTLPGVLVALIHDIAVTPDFYVVVAGPVDFSMSKFVSQYLTSRCSIAECLEYKPDGKPTTVHLVPRPGGKAAGTKPYVMNAPAMFTFHHVNAYQVPASSIDGRQLLVLDTVGWDEVSFENNQYNLTTDYYKGGPRSELQRLVFELDPPKPLAGAGSSSSTPSTGCCISRQRLLTRTLEFPCVNWDWHGQQHSHMYCCADTVNDAYHWGPPQAVLKVTFDNSAPKDRQSITHPKLQTQLWDAGARHLVCEPLFVPRPQPSAEDDGWVLAVLHNAEADKGELVILDAQHIDQGPLATIKLPHHLAAGLHGSFSPQVLLKGWEAAAARSCREANVVRAI